jgi:hypothetical protein
MKALLLSLLLAASASAQLLTELKDYPLFEISVTHQVSGTKTGRNYQQTIEVRWDRLDNKPTTVQVLTSKLIHTDPRASSLAPHPGTKAEKDVDYVKIFTALKQFTDTYTLVPSSMPTHKAFEQVRERVISQDEPLNTVKLRFGWQGQACDFNVFEGYQKTSYDAAVKLFQAMEKELNEDQRKIMADPVFIHPKDPNK